MGLRVCPRQDTQRSSIAMSICYVSEKREGSVCQESTTLLKERPDDAVNLRWLPCAVR